MPPQLPAVSFSPPAIAGPPHVEILDLPLARSSPAVLQYLAVFADPWPGRLAVWRALGAGAFEFQQYVDQPAILGGTENIFGPGVTGRFDRANHLDVKLSGGALSSVDQVSAFAGRNAMAIRGPDGCWEMFSFLNAQLLSAGRWRLCKFIRGHGGSESRAAMTIPAGASVVLLDSAIAPLTSSLSDLGQALTYRIGPADRDYADDAYVEFTATPGASSLKPYSPVRPRGRRTAAGIEISFIRRGRVESDAWEPVNIPLGEESEAYQIDIRSGNNVVRTLSGNATSLVYPQAQELTDFGAAQTQLDVEIYQISAAAGRGFSLRTNISIL